MHKCFRCGTEFEGGFCPECGTKWQEEKFCPQCGSTLSGSVKFCNNCGYSFVETEIHEKKPSNIGAFFKKIWEWVKAHLNIVVPSAIALVAVIVICSLIPTFILMSVNGTYYAYYFDEDGELVFYENSCITLSTGKWKDSDGLEGTYSYSGGNITLKYEDPAMKDLGELFDKDIDAMVQLKGTVENNVLSVKKGTHEQLFVSKNHMHQFGKWEVKNEPTCLATGEEQRVCACKKSETQEVKATGHEIENGMCKLCNIPQLKYELNDNKTFYIVTGFNDGIEKSGAVFVLSEYEGKPVVEIGSGAFWTQEITEVKLSNSIHTIKYGAFADCQYLTSISMPSSVKSIEEGALSACTSLMFINFKGTKAQWRTIQKEEGWNDFSNDFTIQCTDGKLDMNGNEIE